MSRKLQLVRLLSESGNLPIYYDSDEEVYLRAANMPDGNLFACVFNIGFDPIDELAFVIERDVKSVKMLSYDGSAVPVAHRYEEDRVIVEAPAYTLNPVVIIFET